MINWSKVRHFKPSENWGDVDKINPELVYKLDKMRTYANKPFIIHVAYDLSGHATNSYHGKGMAVDGHFRGLGILDHYLLAERFMWGGLGLYTHWKYNGRSIAGIHLDVRETDTGARWASEVKGEYVGLSSTFLLKYG